MVKNYGFLLALVLNMNYLRAKKKLAVEVLLIHRTQIFCSTIPHTRTLSICKMWYESKRLVVSEKWEIDPQFLLLITNVESLPQLAFKVIPYKLKMKQVPKEDGKSKKKNLGITYLKEPEIYVQSYSAGIDIWSTDKNRWTNGLRISATYGWLVSILYSSTKANSKLKAIVTWVPVLYVNLI